MTRLPPYAFILVLFLAVQPVCLNAEQWLQLQPAKAEAIIRFDGTFRSTDTTDANDTDLQTGFRISQSGYALDPAIANFYFQLEPYFSKGESSGTAFAEDRDENFFNYNGRLSLLQGTPGPFAFNLSTSRNNGTSDGSLGNRTEYDVETRFLQMRWKNLSFPMVLQFEQRLLEQVFQSAFGAGSSDRDEIFKSLGLSGRSSKLNLKLERQWLDDRSLLRDNDFELRRGLLAHRLGWNKKNSLRSRVDFTERTGFNAFKQLNFDETATIHHTDKLSSTSLYRHNSMTRERETRANHAEFRLQHQFYRNLTTTAHVSETSIQSSILDEEQDRVGLALQYRKRELFGAVVSARVGKSYREIDRVSQAGLKDIINESHTVPLAGDVLLGERFVLMPSIIVTDAAATQVFTQGLDYEVFAAGNGLTQILVIPGGQINTGDTILVNYQAENLPTLKFSTTQTDINFGMDWGWIAVSHRENRTDDQRISGAAESFLNDRKFASTDVEFRWKRDELNVRFGAERRLIRSGDLETTTYTARQTLSYKPAPFLSMNLTISESLTRSDTRDIDLYNLQYSVSWRPSARLFVRPHIGAWKRMDEGVTVAGNRRKDSFLSAGFELRWSFRSIALDFRYFHNRRGTDTIDTDEDRVMFSLKRRFR